MVRQLTTTEFTTPTGRHQKLTPLQEKILYYRFDHPEMSLTQVAKNLHVQWKTVGKTTTNPICVARENEIRALVDRARVMQRQERLETLTTIARADITDVVSPDGKITITPGKTLAIAEYNTIPGPHGTQRRVKMYSKLTAIELIAKIEGDFHDSQTINNNIINIREVEVRLMGNSVRTEVIDCGSGNTNPSLP